MRVKNIERLDAIAKDYLLPKKEKTTYEMVGRKWGISGCRVSQIVDGFLARRRKLFTRK